MRLDLGVRLGILGIVLALASIAAFYLWPDKKWIGQVCLALIGISALAWGVFEIKERVKDQTLSLLVSVVLGCVLGGVFAWLLWKSVRRSTTPAETANIQLSITCNIVSLPLTYRGELWILDTLVTGGLGKFTAPPSQEAFWPESGVYGMGYVCSIKNYGTQPAFGVSLSLEITTHSWIQLGDTSWGAGAAKGTRTQTILIPWPLAPRGGDEFLFYICSYDTDSSPSVLMPSVAVINTENKLDKKEVPIRISSPENPITVTAKLIREAPKKAKRRR